MQTSPNPPASRPIAWHDQQRELAALIERFTGEDGAHTLAVPNVFLYRSSAPMGLVHGLLMPALCIVAQGRKEVLLGDEVFHYDEANYLLVSVDLPIAGRVTDADPARPYLGLRLDLDPGQIAELLLEATLPPTVVQAPARALQVSPLSSALLDALLRLLRLADTPQDAPILAPLIHREILYRLLFDEQGGRLRQIGLDDSHAQRIAKAISWLKHNFSQPLRIETMARHVNMSPSSLHHHFKAVTAMSPLQYQKQLRLQEARRLMLTEVADAATAGHRVGYESPSQFSREYSRLFGEPPVRDVARLRGTAALAAAAGAGHSP
ncbi:MAG: AraC family transcriptional regulator [Burkholderiales bacterium]|nr:AraC family transcriptional regulator [Burkholderiales bacterium]